MFSFRRKPKHQEVPRIRTSPSLPELNSQGIPWPENLVDVAAIQQAQSEHLQQGAAKVSIQGSSHTVPFHKPFRDSPGTFNDRGPISALYTSNPPSSFPNRQTNNATPVGRYSHRRARVPPTFNIMVVGGKGTGKTSLLRLLLESADISPGASIDQRAVLDRFLRGPPTATQSIQTVCLEICESKFDRVLFSVVDTPGLDFLEGRELKLERQVNGIIKYLDTQYADTMNEESKVVRKSKGDQHIHLCVYVIDPSSIMTTVARRALSSLPFQPRSQTTVSQPPDLVPDTSSGDDSDNSDPTLTLSPAEIRVIRRLSARCNILPVIGHADSLTDEKLHAVKHAVRTSMAEAGLEFSIFNPAPQSTPSKQTHFATPNGNGNGVNTAEHNGTNDHNPEVEASDERQSRPVIKLRSSRHANGATRSRSRSRRDLTIVAAEEDHRPVSPDSADPESLANLRFSARTLARADVSELVPFALIAPEGHRRRQRPFSSDSQVLNTVSSSPVPSQEDDAPPQTPASIRSTRVPYQNGPPDDLRGTFTRKFRWGIIDVLNPNHCDFAAFRTAILSTHLKLLKTHTKEVLYEKYRTEKLLARRATQNISEDDRQRLLEDLGL